MIPATHPYIARYTHENTQPDGTTHTYYTDKPVIAWDEDGHPLVAGKARLERADTWRNFDRITEAKPQTVAVIPGGGWMTEYKDDATGETWSDPVLAWTVRSDGTCQPIDMDADGWSDDPTEDESFVRLYHPGDTPAEATADAPAK